jgi:hypothetical protein
MADILVGRGVRRPAPTLFDLITGPTTAAQSALGAMGSAAKGAAQATVGLPGDVESLVRMLTGGEQRLPTTEQVGQFVNQYIRSPYPQYERLGEFTGLPTAGALTRPTAKITNEAADALVRAITRNPEATAQRVIQETSMPFMQAVAPRMPSLLETPVKSDLGFYSALEQATLPLQNKGTGTQFLAQIEKTAGVKPEEVKWTGLDEFLKSRQNVTKQEVQDYLAANRVNLQEVQLGTLTPEQSELRNASLNRYRMLTDEIATARQMADEGSLPPEDARRYISRRTAERDQLDQTINQLNLSNTTKFSSYTLPGGENYREILLTLPATKAFDKTSPAMQQMAAEMYGANNVGRLSEGQWEIVAKKAQGTLGQEFKSSHFDQPNILAHMRVNDRVVDGKKTLFIEEIQSDWHQAGRKKGYQTGAKAELPEGTKVFEPGSPDSPGQTNQAFTVQLPQSVAGRSLFYGTTREEALTNAQSFIAQPSLGAVPDAPFKTSWHELSLKRAIQEASEKGYDRIAFTTGKTQAERYDLSKQISRVVYNEPGSKRADKFGTVLYAYDKNGDQVLNKTVAPNELSDYIGKEAADRLLKAQADSYGQKELAGVDLQIGGEGMKGFYDQILPKSLEKLGKKFDAKVGKTDMDGVEVWSMDITPKMRESVLTKGQPLFAATPAIPAAGLLGDEGE